MSCKCLLSIEIKSLAAFHQSKDMGVQRMAVPLRDCHEMRDYEDPTELQNLKTCSQVDSKVIRHILIRRELKG